MDCVATRHKGAGMRWFRLPPGVLLIALLIATIAVVRGQPATPTSTRAADNAPVYTTTRPSSDGIGKVYMGREIAQVMGHLGAEWLERTDREHEEQPTKAIE